VSAIYLGSDSRVDKQSDLVSLGLVMSTFEIAAGETRAPVVNTFWKTVKDKTGINLRSRLATGAVARLIASQVTSTYPITS
jgi:hypothetical protein